VINNGCDDQSALTYCSQTVGVDLNGDRQIDCQRGQTPAGTINSEVAMKCYDVIPVCQCGTEFLNQDNCMQLFYDNYTKQGFAYGQALSQITQNFQSGGKTQPFS